MKMELIRSSETSAIKTQTPGNYPKRNILQLKHGESLKTILVLFVVSNSLLCAIEFENFHVSLNISHVMLICVFAKYITCYAHMCLRKKSNFISCFSYQIS